MMCNLLIDLVEQEINKYGELFISHLSSLMDIADIEYILERKIAICSILVQSYWRLALSEKIWQKSANFQTDIIKSVAVAYKNCPNEYQPQFRSIFILIFNLSVENIAECLYNEFGDLSIEMLFIWGESTHDDDALKRWSTICSNNQSLSVNKLSHSSNAFLFANILMQLNPYTTDLCNVDISVWVNLYKQFCFESNNSKLNSLYAQFMLPIIIKSRNRFPDKFVSFAYKIVHEILSKDAMDYRSWQKLSKLLPEVAWYSAWDKCKRLRKSAKQKQYDISF